jgi:phage/plasmid-like protein (TIGR03299 family)
MSKETLEWIRTRIRVGYTSADGPAWHANTSRDENGQPEYLSDGTHFDGPVPESEVRRILDVRLVSAELYGQYVLDGQREVIKADDRQGIVLIGHGMTEMVGVFKAGYKIHNYDEWINGSIQDTLREHPSWGTKSVGLLRKGAVAWHQVKLPDTVKVAGIDVGTPLVTAFTSADGSLASGACAGIDLTVCDNTLSLAIRRAVHSFKRRHTSGSAYDASEMAEALNLDIAGDATEMLEDLASIDVSDDDFRLWLDEMVKVPEKQTKLGKNGKPLRPGRGFTLATNKRDEITRLFYEDPKVTLFGQTGLGLLQAWNTDRTWNRTVQSADGGRMERNLTNDVVGISAQDDTSALDALAKVQAKRLTFA